MPDYLDLLRQLAAVFSPREAEAKMFPMDDRASRMIKLQREAQAPAPGSPEAEAPLTGRWFSPERRALYQDIGRATEAHPKTVEVAAPIEWPKTDSTVVGRYHPSTDRIEIAPRNYEYYPELGRSPETVVDQPAGSSAPGLRPMPPSALTTQDTLAHEQLHFLMQKLMAAEARERITQMDDKLLPLKFGSRKFNAALKRFETPTGSVQAFDTDDAQHALIDYLWGAGSPTPYITKDTYAEPMSGTHPPAASPEIADAYRRLIHQIFPEGERRERALAGLGASRGGTLLEELR